MTQWRKRVEREYLETDRRFVQEELPIGNVDSSSFGLIADATRYSLVEEGGQLSLRGNIAAMDEILGSLSRTGASVSRDDALSAVQRFAETWEALIKEHGKWDDVVAIAREHNEVCSAPPPEEPPRRRWWKRR